MTATTFASAFAACPLVAILRGVRPGEVADVGVALVDAGFTLVEVPLNSPDPLDSIARLAATIGDRALVGAGTVLRIADVDAVRGAGGRMIISPHSDPAVIAHSAASGLISIPGYQTPTEAFAAIAAGAHALKLFPAEAASPATFKAQGAVLPRAIPRLVVGGITADTLAPWHAAGADGYGLGSALYKPGMTAATVGTNARAFVAAWRALAA
ncbi:MAG: hypothetical protein RLZZ58_1833 [Pseudomonadota bacterium]